MSKHRWRESLQFLRENYMANEKDEQLKMSKLEIQNKVTKVVKLLNERRHSNRKNRNVEGNSKRDSEISQLVEDLNEQYLFMYDLHVDLKKELAHTYDEITEEGFYTASSDSSSETSEDRHSNDDLKVESRNKEVEDLERKFTYVAQDRESLISKHNEAQSKIKELERIVQLLEDGSKKLKDKLDENRPNNKEDLVLIKGLEERVEILSHENRQLKEQMEMKESEYEVVTSHKKAMKEKEDELCALQSRAKGLELELNDLKEKKRELEEQMLSKYEENSCLKDEVGGLLEKISKLEDMVQQVNKDDESSMSIQLQALTREVNQLQQEVDAKRNNVIKTLNEEKDVLERKLLGLEISLSRREDKVAKLNRKLLLSENEASTRIGLLNTQMDSIQQQVGIERDKSTEKIAFLEKQNAEFASKISDQQTILKQQEDTINSLRADCKLAKIQLLQAADRKMEEMAQEFRNSFEANIRILRQRVRLAEQIQSENKETCKGIKERCEQYHLGLENKVLEYSQLIATSKGEVTNFFNASNEMLAGYQSLFDRFEDKEGDFSTRISRVLDEITIMKNWVKVTTNEMKSVKEECTTPTAITLDLDDDKARLMRGLYDLQKKVAQLEKRAAEKEQVVLKLVDEKKEAIRQLCFSVEYHQNRCHQLIKFLSKGKGRY